MAPLAVHFLHDRIVAANKVTKIVHATTMTGTRYLVSCCTRALFSTGSTEGVELDAMAVWVSDITWLLDIPDDNLVEDGVGTSCVEAPRVREVDNTMVGGNAVEFRPLTTAGLPIDVNVGLVSEVRGTGAVVILRDWDKCDDEGFEEGFAPR